MRVLDRIQRSRMMTMNGWPTVIAAQLRTGRALLAAYRRKLGRLAVRSVALGAVAAELIGARPLSRCENQAG